MVGIPASLYLLDIQPSLSAVAIGQVGDAFLAMVDPAESYEPFYQHH